jgi:hypothetical protein
MHDTIFFKLSGAALVPARYRARRASGRVSMFQVAAATADVADADRRRQIPHDIDDMPFRHEDAMHDGSAVKHSSWLQYLSCVPPRRLAASSWLRTRLPWGAQGA